MIDLGTISLISADVEEFTVSLFSEVSKGQNYKQRLAKRKLYNLIDIFQDYKV